MLQFSWKIHINNKPKINSKQNPAILLSTPTLCLAQQTYGKLNISAQSKIAKIG
jgi:hypothetical protein